MKHSTIKLPAMDPRDPSALTSSPLGGCKEISRYVQYRVLLEASPDAIVVVNQFGAIALVNVQAERLFGYCQDELIGKPAEILVSQRFRAQHSDQNSRFLAATSEGPKVVGFELFGLRKDGSEFPAEIRLSTLETTHGILGSSGTRDIGGSMGTEEELCRFASMDEHSDAAIIAAGMQRADLPNNMEMILMLVAVNQALVSLQNTCVASERIRTKQTVEILQEEIGHALMLEGIIGSSSALKGVLSQVAMVAPTDSTVLITGETGTGKELIARAVHKLSRRASREFVVVNCAALPAALITSELFGHEKGAFTGAHQRRLGRFELAEGGTIFLDEVGELPAETQIALLRVLQDHEFERVGGSKRIKTNARIIVATNCNLKAAMADGIFRMDLFYRLNVFPVEVPPLRDRKEDIPMLVKYFMLRFASKAGKKIQKLAKESLELLQSYHWPGNIRELENIIERSVVLTESDTLFIKESWLSKEAPQRSLSALPEELQSQEREIIRTALTASKGRVAGPSGAATKLGIPSSTLESKIRALKVSKNQFKFD